MITILKNAASIPLDQQSGSLPQVSDALYSWFQNMTFTTIVKTVVNFQVVETPTVLVTMGVKQPFTPEMLLIKPEGQRSWIWSTVHCLPNIELKPDDVITYLNIQYRVMQKLDWHEYGFYEYHLVEDYTGSGP